MVHKYVRKVIKKYDWEATKKYDKVGYYDIQNVCNILSEQKQNTKLLFELTFETRNRSYGHVERERVTVTEAEGKYTGKVHSGSVMWGDLCYSFLFFCLLMFPNCLQSTNINYSVIVKELFFRPKKVYRVEGKLNQSNEAQRRLLEVSAEFPKVWSVWLFPEKGFVVEFIW